MKNNLQKRQPLWRLIPTLLAFMLFAVSGRGQTYLQESFDDATFPPTGWTQAQLNLTGLWARVTSGTSPTCANHSGAGMLKYNCYSYSNGTSAAIISPNIDLSAASNVSVEFWMYRDAGYATNVDNVEVLINTAASVTGATSLGVINRPKASSPVETGADGWYKYSFTIPASFNTVTNYLLFKATGKYGNNIFVDDIKVFTPTIPNGVPTTFSTTAVSKTGMTINWVDNSTDETGFSVYSSSDNIAFSKYGTDIVSTSSATTGNSYSTNVTGLTYGHTYYFKIVAYSGGETAPLTGNQATLSGDAGDAAPTSLTFTSVGLSAMTLNWVDNSTNETAFRVCRATDIAGPYTQFGTDIPSTTSAGIGTTYNAASTGLTQSTTYFYKVVAVCDLESPALIGSQATTAPVPMSGTYTVGHAAANYQSLSAAFTDITGNGLTGAINLVLQTDYDAYDEPAFPVVPSKNATATNTITIYPAVTGVAIDYSSPTGLLNFDGVSYVTIDGRVGGVGSTVDLILKNGSMGNYVVQLVNGASNNTIKYCTVKGGSNTNTIGLITFGATTGLTGNDNNLIDHCDIKPAVLYYTTGIYSSGSSTLGKENIGNTISNCTISNFCNLSSTSGDNGVYLAGGNTDWTITGNSFYQTASRSYTGAATHYAVNISSPSGNNFVVTNNYIGGSAANAGGSPWTITYSTALANRFVGIKMSVASSVASSLQGNTIANIALNSSSASTTLGGVWCGIYIASGKVNVGDILGNTIGNSSSTGSITSTITTSGGLSTGIYVEGSSTVANISNNTIGSIVTAGSTTSISHSFTGIVSTGGNLTINGNTIGSTSTANSINASTAATGTTAQVVTAINNSSSGTVTISNNSIANLNNAYAPSSANSNTIVRGIISSNGTTSITGNIVRDLTSIANATGTSGSASVIGIALTSSVAPALISQNSVYNLTNNYPGTSAVLVTGLYYAGPSSGTVERNIFYGLNSASTNEGTTLCGIQINSGTTTYQNNIVSLGSNVSTGYVIYGIYENMGTNNVYFNSIYIGGTAATSNQRTFAFYGNQTYTTRLFKNNIFVNARNTSAGSGKNYAVKVGGSGVNPSGLTCDYNIYQVSSSAGVLGFFNNADVADLTAWQTAVGQDAHSLNVDPKYVNPSSATPDLHLQGGSPADMAGLEIGEITTDFFGDIRASLTPTDIGADAGNFDNVVPTVTVTPIEGATGVSVGDNIIFSFSEKVRKTDNSAIDASVISFVNITDGNSAVPFAVVYDDVAKTLTVKLSPNGTAMHGFKNYKVSITGIEDNNDNALANTSTSFTTGTDDFAAPTFVSAVVENAAPKNVLVTFSENVKMDNANGFTVMVAGNATTVSSYTLSNGVLSLTLSEEITSHQAVTVEYTGGNVKDISDNPLADFAVQPVTNNTKSSAKDFLTFSILKANNNLLAEDIVGYIGGNSVDLYVPAATAINNLKATFSISQYAQLVEVGTISQTSDVTANDYTSEVIYKITAEDNSTKVFTVMVHFIHAVPYAQSFDAAIFPPTDWLVVNSGMGNNWSRSGSAQTGAGSMYYFANTTNAANAWAYTPALNLEVGKKYVVEFWEKAAGSIWSEKMKVTVGQQPNVAAQTTELWKNENIGNSSWTKVKATYTAPASGNYHFGFNCYSNANQYNLYIDEVNVREISNNALLTAIRVNGISLAGFVGTTSDYSKILPYGTTEIPTLTVTLADANATSVITPATNLTGTDVERTATIVITAEDGITTNTYTVVYSIAKNPDAKLTDIKVDNTTLAGFSSTVYAYNVELPYNATVIPQITEATLSSSAASKVITQAVNLTGTIAERTAKVVVTAEDGTSTATYAVIFSLGAPTKYAVNFSVIGSHGTLTAVVDGGYITNGELVVEGKCVEFTATPAAGYRVKEWKSSGVVVNGSTPTSYSIASLSAIATITVEFEAIPLTTYAVNFSVVGSNGTLTAVVDGGYIANGELVVAGKDVAFIATPAAGYRVKEWVNGSAVAGNTSNTYIITSIASAATVTVDFEQIPAITYAVNFSVVGLNGTISATVDGSTITSGTLVEGGKDVVFSATPDADYKVKEWKNGTIVAGNATNSYTISDLGSNVTVSVEFMSTTGIDDTDAIIAEAYPNPFNASINIKNASNVSSIEILNISGKLLVSIDCENSNDLNINTKDLLNGVYFIRIVDTKGKVSIRKMIKE